MKFDRFLAKLFSKKVMVCVLVLLILAMLMSSCRFTEEDCWYCFCFGCLSPKTCYNCGMDYLDCRAEECSCLFWFCTGWVDCDSCRSAEGAARLDESCVGQTTVHIFDCINEYCEDCEACQECD